MKLEINKYYITQNRCKVLVAGDGRSASPPFRGFFGILYYSDLKFPTVKLRKKIKWDIYGVSKNNGDTLIKEWSPNDNL